MKRCFCYNEATLCYNETTVTSSVNEMRRFAGLVMTSINI